MASSGSFNTTGGYQGRVLNFSWAIQSQDVASNTSIISWSLTGAGDAVSSWYNSGNFRVIVDGTERYFSATRIHLYNGTLVASGTVTINHNSDGTRSFSAYAEAGIYTTAVNSTGSGSWDLDTIARASQPKLNTYTVNYGDSVVIYTNRASSSFTHNLRYVWNDQSGTIANGVSDNYTWTIPLTFMTYIPNDVSSWGRIICDTYSNGILIGTKEVNLTTNVPSTVVPSFTTVTCTEANSSVNTIVAKYVQNLSNLNLAITGAAGNYGSTIVNYSITCDGITYNNSSIATSALKTSGTLTIIGTITDSRGRTATKNITITVLPYNIPSITSFTLARCDSNGALNTIGTYVKVISTGSVSSLINGTEKNNLTYKIYSKGRNDSTWVTKKTTTLVSLSLNASDILGTYEAILSFDFKLEIIDKFNTTFTLTVLPTSQVCMSWSKVGVGIGKVWEHGILDVGGDIYESDVKLSDKYMAKSLTTSLIPTGAIIWYAKSTPPTGLLFCNGGALSRTTYSALFSVIGTTFGAGDGSTTFNLPDLRGQFIRGWDSGRGVDSGRTFGSWQDDAFELHNHILPTGYSGGTWNAGYYGQIANVGNDGAEHVFYNSVSNVGGTETRPKNISLLPCIKY